MEVIFTICKQFLKIVLRFLFVKMKNSDHKITDNLIIKGKLFCCEDRLTAFVIQPYPHRYGF